MDQTQSSHVKVSGDLGDSNGNVIPNDLPNGIDALKEYHNGEITDRNGQHHPIAEFLYQLTKMLTDDNQEVIEWIDGRIKVHYPDRLEAEVLHRYFRHSKFASFQRQLNYFGFRKIAGKGKMSPCSYVNEAATSDIRSLLLIKRKTNGNARKNAMQEHMHGGMMNAMNPMAFQMAGQNHIGLFNAQMGDNRQIMQNALNQLQLLNQQPGNQNHANNHLQQQQTNPLFAFQQKQLQQQPYIHQLQQQQQLAMPPPSAPTPSTLTQNIYTSQLSNAVPSASVNKNNNNFNSQSSFEQFQAQLAALTGNASFNGAAALPSMNSFSLPLKTVQRNNPTAPAPNSENPATAALNAQMSGDNNNLATAAMNASAASSNFNPFESAINLNSLLGENNNQDNKQQQSQFSIPMNGNMSSLLLSQLPSSSFIFPSSASFGNLLGSTNRLNSLLSLNSFGASREPSLADFAAVAMQQQQQQQKPAAAKKVGDRA